MAAATTNKKTAAKKKPAAKAAKKPAAKVKKPPRPVKKQAPKRAPKRVGANKAAEVETPEEQVFPVEVEAGQIQKTLERLRGELSHWVKKGRYTKVRFKFRGKPVLPDLPIGAVVAAEAMTFWWAGLLQALLVTVGAQTVLQMELISEADLEVAKGKDLLLAGELDRALLQFQKAIAMDRDCAAGHLNVGIALRLKGDRPAAKAAFERARELSPDSPVGAEADRLLRQLAEQEAGTPLNTAQGR